MKNKIITKNGIYSFTPIHLYLGRKIIDRDVCKNNLLIFKEVLDSANIKFGLMFGTLLGAVRENNFIEYDEDVDVYVLDEYRECLLPLLFNLKEYGFEVARYEDNLLTIIKDDDYIDIYFFKKKFFNRRVCMQYDYKAGLLSAFTQIQFLNVMFNVPKKYIQLLEELYGKDWETPKKNAHAEATQKIEKIEILKNIFKIKVPQKVYKTNHNFSRLFNKINIQIKDLKNDNQYLIYGAGIISDLIYSLIKENIVTRVDQNSALIDHNIKQSATYSLENIKNIKFDKIIISVLGREAEIIHYLTQKQNIELNNIITFDLTK